MLGICDFINLTTPKRARTYAGNPPNGGTDLAPRTRFSILNKTEMWEYNARFRLRFLLDIKQFLVWECIHRYVSLARQIYKVNNCNKLTNWYYLAHFLPVYDYDMLSTKLHNSEIESRYLPSASLTPGKMKALGFLYKTFPNVIALLSLVTALILVHLLN